VSFEKSVFINCPFDKEYEPILQAMLFCVVYLGLEPRFSGEREDSSENRLDKIVELIKSSKYSVHDLSRSEAKTKGELARHNMPFELGVDYGCKKFFTRCKSKKILILDEKKYRYQAALSDIAGCDIKYHGSNYRKAVRNLRSWLVSEAEARNVGPEKILRKWVDFQEWYYELQLAAGASDEDIQEYPTGEMLIQMKKWVEEVEFK